MMRQIEVSVDVFAAIWAARLPSENNENEIIARIMNLGKLKNVPSLDNLSTRAVARNSSVDEISKIKATPKSKKWTDVLIWTLAELGGRATLAEIYYKSRIGRSALGLAITAEHDASARECLKSHCRFQQISREGRLILYARGEGSWNLGSQVSRRTVGKSNTRLLASSPNRLSSSSNASACSSKPPSPAPAPPSRMPPQTHPPPAQSPSSSARPPSPG